MKKSLRLLAHAAWDRILLDPRATEQMVACRFPKSPRIFGTSTKITKGQKKGILTIVAYLSMAKESGRNMCPWSSSACVAACLGHSSGQMVFDSSRNSRVWKTALFLYARPVFNALVAAELRQLQKKAAKIGMVPAARLNGTSDVIPAWEVAKSFPDIAFYDYTKSFSRALDAAEGKFPTNYHVTFSRSGTNDHECLTILALGGNVAVVFSGDLPSSWSGFPVLDADESDARFTDAPGHVAGLSFKGNTDPVEAGSFLAVGV